jgi:hypothetical protein
MICFAVSGFGGTYYQVNPWDSYGPAYANCPVQDPPLSTIPSVTFNAIGAPSMSFGFLLTRGNPLSPTGGFALYQSTGNVSGTISNGIFIENLYNTTPQTGLSPGWSANNSNWMMSGDSLDENPSPPASSAIFFSIDW